MSYILQSRSRNNGVQPIQDIIEKGIRSESAGRMQILDYICTMQSQLDRAASASPETPAQPHHKVYGFAMNSTWADVCKTIARTLPSAARPL